MEKMRYYALWLALACIIIFVLQLIIPIFTDALVLNQLSWHEPYRFITSIFLHGSLQHLILNLFALILFGLILEKLVGGKRFLLVFFASGIIANLIAVNFYNSSLGVSGAIYGIIGCLALLRPLMVVWAFGMPMPMFIAAILWAALDIIGIFYPTGTGNIAHLTGLGVGLILGAFFRIFHTKKSVLRYGIQLDENAIRDWEKRHIER